MDGPEALDLRVLTLRRLAPVSITLGALLGCGVETTERETPRDAVTASAAASRAAAAVEESPAPYVGETSRARAAERWAAVRERLAASDIAHMTLLIGTATGPVFVHNKGQSTAQTIYELGSGTKWLSAATIMRLVENGVLSLEDHPQDFIRWWAPERTDARRNITLRQLLSFTSGLTGNALSVRCVNNPRLTLEQCAYQIYDKHYEHDPGTVFHYGPPHLQVAGLMAEKASGRSWHDLFYTQLANLVGLRETHFFFASPQNPRVAGGAVSSARDYGRFLSAMLGGRILTRGYQELFVDHTPIGQVTIEEAPIPLAIGQQWHYALGAWRECHATTWRPECDEPKRLSSPGIYGWYPWIDLEHGYWGVLAMQLPFDADNRPTTRSLSLALGLQPLIEQALAN